MISRGLLGAIVLLSMAGSAPLCQDAPESRRPRQQPHFDAKEHQTEYAGPGREDPAPDDLDEVLIGYFGPGDPLHPEGGDMWLASGLAVEEANAAGGHHGLPYRLVPAWSENPWGTGVSQVARMVYVDEVWAIVGSIDGASTHLAEQVVTKARLTLINPASTDKTVNLANVAWMFSCLPADDLQAPVLGQALVDRIGKEPFVLLSATDHDSHAALVEFRKVMDGLGIGPLYHLEFEPGARDLTKMVERSALSGSRAAVILAGPRDSARLTVALRGADDELQIFGGPSMGRRLFLEEAGTAADGVLFPFLCDPSVFSSRFSETFTSRFGKRPDCTAAQTYDATRLLLAAIGKAGLNRARIRDAVQALSPWSGPSGTIEWNRLGQNQRRVLPATIENGRIVPLR